MQKLVQVGACNSTFWGPLYIFVTSKVRHFKFGVRIDRQACKPNNAKMGQKNSWRNSSVETKTLN